MTLIRFRQHGTAIQLCLQVKEKINTNNMPTPDLMAEKCVGKNL